MKKLTGKKILQTEKKSSPEPSAELHNIDLHKNNPQSLRERISEAAYDLFLKRGAAHGNDLGDWLEAEHMVLAKHERTQSDLRG